MNWLCRDYALRICTNSRTDKWELQTMFRRKQYCRITMPVTFIYTTYMYWVKYFYFNAITPLLEKWLSMVSAFQKLKRIIGSCIFHLKNEILTLTQGIVVWTNLSLQYMTMLTCCLTYCTLVLNEKNIFKEFSNISLCKNQIPIVTSLWILQP